MFCYLRMLLQAELFVSEETFESVSPWLTPAVAIFLAILTIARYKQNNDLKKAVALPFVVFTCFCAVVAVVALTVYADGNAYDEKTVWLAVTFFLSLVCASLSVLSSSKKKRLSTLFGTVAFCLFFVFVFLLLLRKTEISPSDKTLMYFLSVLLLAVVAFLSFWGKGKPKFDARSLSFGACCIALSFALSFIKLFSLPQGGSVTFASLLPLMLFSFAFGSPSGFLVGVVYGILQFFQSPQFYEPMQFLLDYPIAFASVGIAGVFANAGFSPRLKFLSGATLAVVFRYCAHVLSGYFVFNVWTPEGFSALAWALVYNLFIFVDLIPVLVCGFVALSSKSVVKLIDNSSV